MAEPDQRDGEAAVTPPVDAATPETQDVGTSGPQTEPNPRKVRGRPVRTAPIRRGARPKSAAPTEENEPSTSDLDDTDDTGTGTAVEADATAVIEPDPADVERTVSYRERRQARLGGGEASKKVRYRGSRSRSVRRVVPVVMALVLIVASAIASVVFALGISRQNDLDALRAEYSGFAQQVIVNLTSMNPKTVDAALATVQNDTSGRVKQQLQDSIQQVVGLVKDTKVETKTTVLSEAVTKAESDEGSVIMVFGWEQNSLDGSVPTQVKTFRWRVDITRINGELKMTNFEWVA